MTRKTLAATLLIPATALLMGAAPFGANKWAVRSMANLQVGPNQYTVQFPEALGGQTLQMSVVQGLYQIRFHAQERKALLHRWIQHVAPIEIQGMSTGPITITMEPQLPSSGTYDENGGPDRRGSFELSAFFRIEFDDSELQQIGLTSPFIMEAGESGVIRADGKLVMTADGVGEILGFPLVFQCITTTKLDQIQFLDPIQ